MNILHLYPNINKYLKNIKRKFIKIQRKLDKFINIAMINSPKIFFLDSMKLKILQNIFLPKIHMGNVFA
jgi:uncharacterized protein YqcC (DUF446 family)